MRLIFTATVVVAFVAVGCAPQGSQPSPELAAMSDRFEEAVHSGNLDTLISLYTSDCRIMPPNTPMGIGADAVAANFGEMIDAGLSVDLDVLEATTAGDIGYRVGAYVVSAPDGTEIDTGKFIDLWRKTAAGWQTSNDIWNSDLAADAGKTFVTFTHEVEDPDVWLAAWTGPDSRKQMFAENGAGEIKVFMSPDDPNQVGLLVEVLDMDALMAMLNSPEGAVAMDEDGVVESSLSFMTEVK
jgi:ketosteroid isomerase-like protein